MALQWNKNTVVGRIVWGPNTTMFIRVDVIVSLIQPVHKVMATIVAKLLLHLLAENGCTLTIAAPSQQSSLGHTA